MIGLQVESYCQNCSDFEPIKDIVTWCSTDGSDGISTVIKCDQAERCRAFYEHIRDHYTKETEVNHD